MFESVFTFFMLAVVFQFKHLLSDYFWQGKYMLGKFKESGWAIPLAAHCGVHAVMTFVIAFAVTFNPLVALGLCAFDFLTHFIIDRAKVVSSRGLTPQDPKFWHHLGCDQTLHHIIHYFIILALVVL